MIAMIARPAMVQRRVAAAGSIDAFVFLRESGAARSRSLTLFAAFGGRNSPMGARISPWRTRRRRKKLNSSQQCQLTVPGLGFVDVSDCRDSDPATEGGSTL